MREQIKPVVRFLRWYCQPPDVVRAVTLQGAVAASVLLVGARAVVALAVLFAVLERVHVAPVLQGSLGVVVGLSVTIAHAWRGAPHGLGVQHYRDDHGHPATAVGRGTARLGGARLAVGEYDSADESDNRGRHTNDEGGASHLHAPEAEAAEPEPTLNVAVGSLTRGKEG